MQRMQRQHEAWARELPEAEAFWPWLGEQSHEEKLSLLAFCTAQSLHAVQQRLDEQPSNLRPLTHADALHAATGLDMADWWEPARDRYLGRVSKAQVLEALTEAVSRQCADGNRERKRDALIDVAERKLAGTRWLPSLLRMPAPVAAAETEDAPDTVDPTPALPQAA